MRGATFNGNQIGTPAWAGDFVGGRDAVMATPGRISLAAFIGLATVAVQINGAVLAGVTTIVVDAIAAPIPVGSVIAFPVVGTSVVTTARAETGATTIYIKPLPANLADNSVGTYVKTGGVFIPSGTAVGRTIAERDANAEWGPAADADDEVRLLAFDVIDATQLADCELYRPGRMVKENFLPNIGTLSATVKTKLRATYVCTIGVD